MLVNKNFKNSWIQTYSGKQFFPLNPDKNQICIEDIAHSLGKICRFNGHSKTFYSVAEHSIYVSQKVSKENMLWGLLHDASEAYLGDIPKPIKPYLHGYKEIENALCQCIASKFNLPYPIPIEVKITDTRILRDEADQLMEERRNPWSQLVLPGFGIKINKYNHSEATSKFLERYHHLIKPG